MAKNFPYLVKLINPQISGQIFRAKPSNKIAQSQDKEKNLKASQRGGEKICSKEH